VCTMVQRALVGRTEKAYRAQSLVGSNIMFVSGTSFFLRKFLDKVLYMFLMISILPTQVKISNIKILITNVVHIR
jgi:hypothetical protein